MLGQLLDGRYRVLKVLGAGGFSQTYIAEDTRRPGNPCCVVKHLKPANSNTNFLIAARRLFDKEAKILEKLGIHDQIPRLLAYFEQDQEFYLVQELIEGHLLSAELFGGRRWQEDRTIHMLLDVLGILNFVHQQGAIHRDVKPNNIIRRQQDNKLVLVDFGIVKEINVQLLTAQSQVSASIAVGTVGYMPPEQARGRPQFNSDIYALGVIAIQALTGLTTQDLRENFQGEIDWQGQAQVSDRLAAIINKMVRYDFRERYQSASEVIEALRSPSSIQAGYATTELDQRPRYSPTQQASQYAVLPATAPSTQFSAQSIPSTPVSFTQPATNQNVTTNSPSTQPSKRSGGLAKFAAKLKSPLGMTMGAAAVVSVAAAFGLVVMNKESIKSGLAQVEVLKKTKQYEECIKHGATINIPSSNTIKDKQAQTNLTKSVNECRIAQAKALAEEFKIAEALAVVSTVPAEQPLFEEAQLLTSQWSKIIFQEAKDAYERDGDFEKAILLTRAIPTKSSIFKDVRQTVATWERESKTNQDYLKLAEQALSQSRWQDAVNTAKKIPSSTLFWNTKRNEIVEQANSRLAQKPNPTSPSSAAAKPAQVLPQQPQPVIKAVNSPIQQKIPGSSKAAKSTPEASIPELKQTSTFVEPPASDPCPNGDPAFGCVDDNNSATEEAPNSAIEQEPNGNSTSEDNSPGW
ncbi:MAG: Serine/threonine-protein kinase PknD [Chroococcidiopsis sp. SAG 2025]|uniref:serine/threonine-protein kinase n=1 Tax=Chroococcidiopsis sp. SAG 2025 TaxID=171389 RepID=UPI002936EF79|nr:serine/threonine-protein kinase [Chroococcidiopsis sp. SAG 2025]MDV2995311.1 Serine/threonine-protein kinase PknD [Chroococcidiopsis sp. SAG 2025]